MTREPDFKRIEKKAAIVFWRRAIQCEVAMKDALARGHWEAAGINAVHCAISANDAILAAIPAIKAAGKDHRDAVRLLSSRIKGEDARAAAKRLDIIISKKSRVEYEQKRISEKEARSLVLEAERFLEWAGSQLPKEFK